MTSSIRLAVDIGGTFTDVALELNDHQFTYKVLTTPRAPEQAVLTGIQAVLEQAGIGLDQVDLIIHGTTLATNALIERKGARTALIVTEGFRDSVEMAYENRFEQYDINMERPAPLVPRYLRWPVRERLNAHGEVLLELDEQGVFDLLPRLQEHGIESVAIGLLHAYANSAHEQRIAAIIRAENPALSISLSSETCPEIREYERLSTTCANAYVQPLMARYLRRLDQALRQRGLVCPFLLMTSGGGLCTLDTAMKFPIRLVESGPAGGAILASSIAAECGLNRVLSYDMGGTTAKICLLDDGKPLMSRTFEVDRIYRFMKGSGLPVRIPCIEMVEIGAGGGSIAAVDTLNRVTVGPASAGAEPGPACYGRGGTAATVTDADMLLGRIDSSRFAGGNVALDADQSACALEQHIGQPLNLNPTLAAFAVSEIVDENMANSARVHAIEWGKELGSRTLIAFGGAAPLHAARLAEKLGLQRVVIPAGAGVGSALGFLRAPVAYEVVRSRYHRLSYFDADFANALLTEMHAEAAAIVREAAPTAALEETRSAFMRYRGQGHEINVNLPLRALTAADAATLQDAFNQAYTQLYGRLIPDLDVEILSWTLTLSTPRAQPEPVELSAPAQGAVPEPTATRLLFDSQRADFVTAAVYARETLTAGARIEGPALIVEDQTSTVVNHGFSAWVTQTGYLVLENTRL